MASINYATREISCKIVYYGPGLSGKTTNLQIIHRKIPVESKSEMVSLATETDRTLFFDFLPLDLGSIKGFATKFQLYTVPGQVYYNATRKLVLRGVDGVVFVADSQRDKMQENIDSLRNLQENLKEYGIDLATVPFVLQYNKRDLPGIASIVELDQQLNWHGVPTYEAQAHQGIGVFTTLKAIGKIVIDTFNSKYTARQSSRKPGSSAPEPQSTHSTAPTPPPRPVAPAPVAPPPAPAPMAAPPRPAPPPPLPPVARPNPAAPAPFVQPPPFVPLPTGNYPSPSLPPLAAPGAPATSPAPQVQPSFAPPAFATTQPAPTPAPPMPPSPAAAPFPPPDPQGFAPFQPPPARTESVQPVPGFQSDYFGNTPSAPAPAAPVPGLQPTIAPPAAPIPVAPVAGLEGFSAPSFASGPGSSGAPSTIQAASASQASAVPSTESKQPKKSKIDGSMDPSDLDAEIARYERELAEQKHAAAAPSPIISNPNVNPNLPSQDPLAAAFLTPEELARLQSPDSYPTRRMPLGPGQP